jgi:hypothetical protein
MIVVPRARAGVRVVNALLGVLPRISLEPGHLIDRARRASGLSDFGPEGPYEEALQVLCRALDDEAALAPVGRLLARQMLVQALTHQLQLQDWLRRDPAILDGPVERPLVIVGMPRTGTTILHELLALDPANRCPATWEVAHPFPPPERATCASDPRIALQARELRVSEYLMPGVQNLHRMGATLPQECVGITAQVFVSMQYNTIFRVPSYTRWLEHGADHDRAYRYHRRFLQYLQRRHAGVRWVLKSPAHLWTLEALLRNYPDARLAQTHRDPLRIVSSLASMLPTMRGAYSRDVDPRAVAQEWSDNCASALAASVASRRAGAIRPEQVCDIHFHAFMRDPVAEVRRLYDQFAIPFSEDFATAIRRYLAENPATKHGGHRHDFADTGLDVMREREKVADYQAYFSVPSED